MRPGKDNDFEPISQENATTLDRAFKKYYSRLLAPAIDVFRAPEDLAEDFVQDAFVDLARRLVDGQLYAYSDRRHGRVYFRVLRSALWRRIWMWMGRAKRHKRGVAEYRVVERGRVSGGAGYLIPDQELWVEVKWVLGGLSELEAGVFVDDVLGFHHEEIAERWGLDDRRRVRIYQSRVRKALAEKRLLRPRRLALISHARMRFGSLSTQQRVMSLPNFKLLSRWVEQHETASHVVIDAKVGAGDVPLVAEFVEALQNAYKALGYGQLSHIPLRVVADLRKEDRPAFDRFLAALADVYKTEGGGELHGTEVQAR